MGLNRKTRAALSFGPPKMGWEGADCKCKQGISIKRVERNPNSFNYLILSEQKEGHRTEWLRLSHPPSLSPLMMVQGFRAAGGSRPSLAGLVSLTFLQWRLPAVRALKNSFHMIWHGGSDGSAGSPHPHPHRNFHFHLNLIYLFYDCSGSLLCIWMREDNKNWICGGCFSWISFRYLVLLSCTFLIACHFWMNDILLWHLDWCGRLSCYLVV